MERIIIGIDVGSNKSGIAVLMDCRIHRACVANNGSVIDLVREYTRDYDVFVVIENIVSYDGKVNADVIATIKWIGELCYRLRAELGISYTLLERWKVKQWCFDNYKDVCLPEIQKNIVRLDNYAIKYNEDNKDKKVFIKRKRYIKKDGSYYSGSFAYVDDRIVIKVMKAHWCIETPKAFQSNPYGLSSHSWQSLGLVTCYIESNMGALDIK